jgi:hypothetical protein
MGWSDDDKRLIRIEERVEVILQVTNEQPAAPILDDR